MLTVFERVQFVRLRVPKTFARTSIKRNMTLLDFKLIRTSQMHQRTRERSCWDCISGAIRDHCSISLPVLAIVLKRET